MGTGAASGLQGIISGAGQVADGAKEAAPTLAQKLTGGTQNGLTAFSQVPLPNFGGSSNGIQGIQMNPNAQQNWLNLLHPKPPQS
jgi:hypothetical protein